MWHTDRGAAQRTEEILGGAGARIERFPESLFKRASNYPASPDIWAVPPRTTQISGDVPLPAFFIALFYQPSSYENLETSSYFQQSDLSNAVHLTT